MERKNWNALLNTQNKGTLAGENALPALKFNNGSKEQRTYGKAAITDCHHSQLLPVIFV